MKTILALILLLINISSFSQTVLESFQCDTENGKSISIKVTKIGQFTYFNLELSESTSVSISIDSESDSIYNDNELFYHSLRKEWVTNEWTKLPMYVYDETRFSLDKKTKEGFYFSKHKRGILDSSYGEEFSFICR